MTSDNVEDWDQPLPSPPEDELEDLTYEEKRHKENMGKLARYVNDMAYRPTEPCPARPRTQELATPNRHKTVDNAKLFAHIVEPPERGDRLKRLASSYNTMTTEELELAIKNDRVRDIKKENALKRKQEIFYGMLNKLERQCRIQYLNVLVSSFGNFIANLATTMHIPPNLADPYARMQRGIFCNILLSIGVQPKNQAAIYYNTPEGSEYAICHKLSHALLSLIIKALDSASTRDPNDVEPVEVGFEMDKYIKERLMCAAEKKVMNLNKKAEEDLDWPDLREVYTRCERMNYQGCKK